MTGIPNDADLEMLELAETANEIDHAIRRGYCLDCDLTSVPGTIRVWNPDTGGHRTVDHDGCGPIGEYGRCAGCQPSYLEWGTS